MEVQKYFSTWLDSRNENPYFFYGVITLMATFLGLFIWFVKFQKQKAKRKKEAVAQSLEVERQKVIDVDVQKLNRDTVDVIQEKVEENKLSTSKNLLSDNAIALKTTSPFIEPIQKTQEVETTKKVDRLNETKIEIPKEVINVPIPKIETVKAEKEEQSKEKYIGYNPINVFAQSEPLSYPFVIMPNANSIIKFPRKGRCGRKGFKEESFKEFIEKYFRSEFRVFDDRFIMVKTSNKPFEPDFTLMDEKNGINIFIDIEIDEPYEGLNGITKRKATHFQHADTNRNNAFASRGWIVIRLAEIQVHQYPLACCKFVADVIKSINPKFVTPIALNCSNLLQPVKQWTKEVAEEWSRQKYREQYLGIKSFGVTSEIQTFDDFEETALGEKIEEKVIEKPKNILPVVSKEKPLNPKVDLIKKSISSSAYLSFTYEGNQTITKPLKTTDIQLNAFCYLKNVERAFNIKEISNLVLKTNYNILRIAGPTIGLDKISNAVNTAISYKRYIRIKYTRSSWNNYIVNKETGELILDRIEAEESVRTIMNVQLSINALTEEHITAYNLNSNYITAYCHKRNEQRTFRFDRIGEIEVLDL